MALLFRHLRLRTAWRIIALLAILALAGQPPLAARAASTLTVNSAADGAPANDGACTLREAIINANNNDQSGSTDCPAGTAPAPDTIAFNIPGPGPHTIALTAALPIIVDPIIIDGSTQPGANCAARQLQIVLDGVGAGIGSNGLAIAAGSSSVRGLVIHRFSSHGVYLSGAGNNTLTCSFIGTDVTGTVDLGNAVSGVRVDDIPNNTIGGVAAGDGNLISGNELEGIGLWGAGASNNVVQGNTIGADVTGSVALGNGTSGIYIAGGPGNVVGGAGAGNVISGNTYGVMVRDATAVNNVIQDNIIGADASGTAPLANSSFGVTLLNLSSLTTISGNLIAYNTLDGIYQEVGIAGTVIQGNRIENNVRRGIWLGGGVIATNTANCITGNASGMDNTSGIPTIAINNWWGSASGPGPVGPGVGDPISSDIVYAPWQGTLPAGCGSVGRAALSASKAFGAASIPLNSTTTLTVTIGNPNPISISNVAFTDPLPAGLQATAAASPQCGGTVDISNPSQIVFSGGVIAAGGVCTITVTVRGVALGVQTNPSFAVGRADGAIPSTSTAPVSITVLESLQIAKQFTDDPVADGGTATLEFTIRNSETVSATAITFSDTLPGGATYVPGSLPIAPCGAGSTLTLSGGDTTLTLGNGSLAAGASCTFAVQVSVPLGLAAGDYVNTSGAVTGVIGGVPVTGNTASDTLIVVNTPTAGKSFDDAVIALNATTTLRVTITNPNTVPATGVSFTDALPTGLEAIAAASPQCGGTVNISNPALIVFSGGAVPAGGSCTVTVTVRGTTPGVKLNQITDVAASFGSVTYAGISTPPTSLIVSDLLAIGKQFTNDPLMPGGTATLRFTIINPDTLNAATNIAFSDTLPGGLTYNPGSLPAAPCGAGSVLTLSGGDTTLNLAGGQLAAGASCSFDVQAPIPAGFAPGNYLNTTSAVTGVIGGVPVTGNTASDTLTVVVPPTPATPPLDTGGPRIVLTGVASPSVAAPGDRVVWTWTISNVGTVGSGPLTFTAQVPDVLTLDGVTASAGAAVFSGQGVTAEIGSLGPGQSATVTINTTLTGGQARWPLTIHARLLGTSRKAGAKARAVQSAGDQVCMTGYVADVSATACLTVFPFELPETGGRPVGAAVGRWVGLGVLILGGAGAWLARRQAARGGR